MSWQQLLAIVAEKAAQRRVDADTPPQACPRDGEPLQAAPDGGLFCRFDGYRWPDDTSAHR